MAQGRKIKACDIVADIRARLTDFELMSKYDLSWELLQDVLKKLVRGNAIRAAELEERSAYFDDPVNRRRTRGAYRAYMRIPIPIEDLNDVFNRGFVTDLSERGFRTRGVTAKNNDDKTFLIRAGDVSEVENLRFNATCRWVNGQDGPRESCEAGFLIMGLSDEDLSRIRRLIQALGLGNRNLGRPK